MIYVPNQDDYRCFYMQSNNVLRAYKTIPNYNTTVNYRDYMIDNHYLYRDGVQTFSNYSTLPVCLSNDDISSNYFYRTDLADILIIFLIIVGGIWFLISKLIKTLFRGHRRY